MKISLFVTGIMEQEALGEALQSLFPGHEFRCIPHTRPNRPFASFTSGRLPVDGASDGVRSQIDILAQRAAAEVLDYSGHHAPNLLLILDDLELTNLDQPNVVIDCFRAAVENHLGTLGPSLRRRTADALRAKASLHFAVPMIESWLFADPGGLTRAGVPASRNNPALPYAPQFESFVVDDEIYLGDDCSWCEQWVKIQERKRITKSIRRAHQPEWCRGKPDERRFRRIHPKRYLAWLCRNAAAKKCSTYREVSKSPTGGDRALRELDWSALLSRTTRMPFLNAMLDDLADGLMTPSPLPSSAPLSPHTRRKHHATALFRNV